MRKIFYICLFLVPALFIAQDLFADAGSQYEEALRLVREKQPDFAFMEFSALVRDFPESKYAGKSIFAMAEYSYDNKNYYDAVRRFTEYINNYPDSKSVVFAKAYLLKIMEEIQNPTLGEKEMLEKIKQDFFSKPLFLLFREYKETLYRSPFQNRFTIRYYIDNIEVYRNGQLFIKISQ